MSPGEMQVGAYVNRVRAENGCICEPKEEAKGVSL